MNFTNSTRYKDNVILKETFEFALLIVQYAEMLEEKKKFAIARQVIRPGTSIGANVKEADETEYWLFLCECLKSYPNPDQLIEKLNNVIKILTKIVSTTKMNNRRRYIKEST